MDDDTLREPLSSLPRVQTPVRLRPLESQRLADEQRLAALPNLPPRMHESFAASTRQLVEHAQHSAELLRQQGDALLTIAQSFKAEADTLATDIEARARRFEERVNEFSKTVSASRDVIIREGTLLEKFFGEQK